MKPDGKSLDIVVIGLGQAGGNLAAEFFRRGYPAIALNTAQTDLDALEEGGVFPALPAERRLYVGLDGYDGAGADPGYGRECVHAHADRIRAAILKQGGDADAIVVTAGLGGGTGSSVAELVQILADEDLPIIAMMTLPTEGESGLAKVNAVRAINEIVDAPLLGWIFVDNGRISSLNQDVSVVDYYAHVNGKIVHPLDAFNRLNTRREARPIRSFDGEDFRKLLLSGGVLNFATTDVPAVTTDEVVGAVKDALESSEIMPGGFDITRLSYLGLVIEAPESALAEAPISTFEDIAEALKEETEGAAVYYGIYRTEPGSPCRVRTIASTPSLPHRIRQVLGDAKREGMRLGEKVQEELPTLELGEIQDVALFRTRTRPSERPKKRGGGLGRRPADLVDDIAKELGGRRRTGGGLIMPDDEPANGAASSEPRPARVVGRGRGRRPVGRDASTLDRAPARRAAPDEAPAAEAPVNPLATPSGPRDPNSPRDLGTEEIDVVAKLAELKDLGDVEGELAETTPAASLAREVRSGGSIVGTAELPSPESYDQLVSDYLNARSPEERGEIADRLEQDSGSDHTVVRYYAVEAMAKLGKKSFGNALLSATEDPDEAVRMLAIEALKS